MKTWFVLGFKSLRHRSFVNSLTVFSIALSVFLLLVIERVRHSTETGFTQTISQTDLIVGARTSGLNLILYSVFNIGQATNNISYETYEELKKNPSLEWTIPYSLGDGHRGFRVVATSEDFFKHYHYRGQEQVEFKEGQAFQNLFDVVVGAEVAKELKYTLEQKIVIAHGVTTGESFSNHDDKPFTIKGVLKPTGTPLDRAVYISLEAMEALHIDWQSGAAPTPEKRIKAEDIKPEDVRPKTITAFFLRTKNRIETLRLQREINNYPEEALTAVIPGVVLSELWRSLNYIEFALKSISWLVMLVGLGGLLSTLLTSLNERRREMSILRALGASPLHILGLLTIESALISSLGVICGVLFTYLSFAIISPILKSSLGFILETGFMQKTELIYLLLILVFGTLIGLIPAFKAMRTSLKDGLILKN